MQNEQQHLDFIGKYKVVSTLGGGSTGGVYKAIDPEVGRVVAIKTLPKVEAESADKVSAILERFRLEVCSAESLRHPNIVPVFDVNLQDGVPYIVMDYIEGESLDVIISKYKQLRPEVVLYYMKQVAAGLDAAHKKGLIHGAIKPTNVIVDLNDTCYLAGFGVSSFSKKVSGQFDEYGAIVGTVGYMSPEQIINKDPSEKSDLFSLAVIAFECFTGGKPFSGSDFTDTLRNILNAEPVALTSLVDLPLSLEAEFERALAKDPAFRFESAEEMVLSFARALGISRIDKPIISEAVGSERGIVIDSGDLAEDFTGDLTEDREVTPFGDFSRTFNQNVEVVKGVNKKIFISIVLVVISLCGGLVYYFLGKTGDAFVISDSGNAEGLNAKNNKGEGVSPSIGTKIFSDEESLKVVSTSGVGKDLTSMTDKELLGVLTNAQSNEKELLNGLSEVRRRRLPDFITIASSLLHHDHHLVRSNTLKVLRDLGDKSCVPVVIEMLGDRDPIVRGTAANTLGALGSKKALAYLVANYKSEEVLEVKIAMKRAIEKINGYPLVE
ncbi:MAG: protein kinase domain-containing protein [Bdellovibrionota bacterium]|jgi:serine/threonine protein kinase